MDGPLGDLFQDSDTDSVAHSASNVLIFLLFVICINYSISAVGSQPRGERPMSGIFDNSHQASACILVY